MEELIVAHKYSELAQKDVQSNPPVSCTLPSCLTGSCACVSWGTRGWWRPSASAGPGTPSATPSWSSWTATGCSCRGWSQPTSRWESSLTGNKCSLLGNLQRYLWGVPPLQKEWCTVWSPGVTVVLWAFQVREKRWQGWQGQAAIFSLSISLMLNRVTVKP